MRSTLTSGKCSALAFGLLVALVAAGPALADPPEFSGIVERGVDTFAQTWVDGRSGTRIVVGADILEFCAGVVDFDMISYQDAVVDSGDDLDDITDDIRRSIARGEDVRVSVWPFTAFDCDMFNSIPPLATGRADWILPDNDLFQNGPGANAWGFSVNGWLETPDGAPARVNAHLRIMVSGNNVSVNSRIILGIHIGM